jgi:hypothetical protein
LQYNASSALDVSVFDLVGISPLMVQQYSFGRVFEPDVEFAIRRMYCALMLLTVWKQGEQLISGSNKQGRSMDESRRSSVGNEKEDDYQPIWRVATEFNVDRGRVQMLLSRASAFGSNVLHFAQVCEYLSFFLLMNKPRYFANCYETNSLFGPIDYGCEKFADVNHRL